MIKFSERVDLRLGYRCNSRCRFCYYQQSLRRSKKELSTEEAKRMLIRIRKEGATEIEFTGGEPTVREDLCELASYAKSLDFVNISIISNGLRLSDSEYVQRLVYAGVNDFHLSIHGHSKELHEQQTRVMGSFEKIVRAIENVQSHTVRCRSNTVINGINYQHIGSILEKLIQLNMKFIHLTMFNPIGQAAKADKDIFVKYSDATKFLKNAISKYKGDLPPLIVKYVPFCFMRGYENYVMNHYQQSFDPDEWNLYLSHKMRHPNASRALALLGDIFLKDYSFPLQHGWSGLKVFGMARFVELLHKKRSKSCNECSYDLVCDHILKNYLAVFGDSEITPIQGPKIKDPLWCYDGPKYRMPGFRLG